MMRGSKVIKRPYFTFSGNVVIPILTLLLLACNCYQFPFLANFFQEEEDNTVNSKGVKVRPARPPVKPTNKQLRTSVGDKVKVFTLPLLVGYSFSSSPVFCCIVFTG